MHRPGRLPTLAVALVVFATGIPARAQAPGDDAMSHALERLGCARLEEMKTSTLQTVMGFWARQFVTVSANQETALAIVARGHVDEAVKEIDKMATLVEVGMGLAAGDAPAALRKASHLGLDYSAGLVGGPIGAAVWGTIKTLGEFAADLSAEIVQLNLGMLANAVDKDPRLRGPSAADVFLDEYVDWQLRRPDANNAVPMRATLIDYASLELQATDVPFPSIRDWRRPENRNRVRVAAQNLVRDAVKIAETRRLQRELASQLPGLQREVEVLREFEAWRTFLKKATCRADVMDEQGDRVSACLTNAQEVAAPLREAEAQVFAVDAERLAGLGRRLDTLDGEVDAAGGLVEASLAQTQGICAQAAAMRAAESALRAALESQAARVEAACAGSGDAAAEAARQAGEAAASIRQRAATARAAAPGAVPELVDFAGLRGRLASLTADAQTAIEQARDARQRHQRSVDAAERAEVLLRPCAGQAERDPKVAEMRARVASLLTRLGGTSLPSADVVSALQGRVAGLRAFVEQQEGRQRDGRACLAQAGTPEERGARLAALGTSADAAAARAGACVSGKRPAPPAGAVAPSFDVGALVGLPLRDAVARVTAAGLAALPQVGSPAATTQRQGLVEKATREGSSVVLIVHGAPVSAGRVPSVVGLPLRHAHVVVEAAGFTPVIEVGDDAPRPGVAGTIARQAPAAGLEIAAGRDVVLVVYSESSPGRVVPSVVGRSLAAASSLLASRDLMTDAVRELPAPSPRQAGQVYRQYPEPQLEIPRGTGVRVWVYGPAAATPPPYVPPSWTPEPRRDHGGGDDGGGYDRDRGYDDRSGGYAGDGYDDGGEVEGPTASEILTDWLKRANSGSQQGGAGSRKGCQYTGDPATDGVLGGIMAGGCEGEKGTFSSQSSGTAGGPGQGEFGGRRGSGQPCKGRGACRVCEGDSIGLPTACLNAIQADVRKQCGQSYTAEFFKCQRRVTDSWEK